MVNSENSDRPERGRSLKEGCEGFLSLGSGSDILVLEKNKRTQTLL